MNVWLLTYHDDNSDSGWVQEWFSSPTHASVRFGEIKRKVEEDEACGYCILHPPKRLQLPQTKGDMVAFLNIWTASG